MLCRRFVQFPQMGSYSFLLHAFVGGIFPENDLASVGVRIGVAGFIERFHFPFAKSTIKLIALVNLLTANSSVIVSVSLSNVNLWNTSLFAPTKLQARIKPSSSDIAL